MKDIVYNFLDKIIGGDVKCRVISKGKNYTHYAIFSISGTLILDFRVFEDLDRIAIFRSSKLCDTVSGFFGIDDQESARYIKFWFGDKHGLNKIGDIKKFIREK
jgi:hypothetical protein